MDPLSRDLLQVHQVSRFVRDPRPSKRCTSTPYTHAPIFSPLPSSSFKIYAYTLFTCHKRSSSTWRFSSVATDRRTTIFELHKTFSFFVSGCIFIPLAVPYSFFFPGNPLPSPLPRSSSASASAMFSSLEFPFVPRNLNGKNPLTPPPLPSLVLFSFNPAGDACSAILIFLEIFFTRSLHLAPCPVPRLAIHTFNHRYRWILQLRAAGDSFSFPAWYINSLFFTVYSFSINKHWNVYEKQGKITEIKRRSVVFDNRTRFRTREISLVAKSNKIRV